MSPPRDHNHNPVSAGGSSPSLRELRSRLSAGGASRSGTAEVDVDDLLPDRVLTAAELLDLVSPRREEAQGRSGVDEVARPAPPSGRTARQLRPATEPGDPAVVRPRRARDRITRRRTGVAPFIRPSVRRSRRQRQRDYRRLGFIELTPEKARLRHRVLPRTVLGVSAMMLSLGVGAAFAGASLYAFYDHRLTENETKVDQFAQGFETNFASAITEVGKARDAALQSISANATLIQDWANSANAIVELPTKVGGGIFAVRTMDTAGRPSVGTAFVVASETDSTLLLTSYELVTAATAKPGPGVTVQQGGGEAIPAEVWAWDPALDLALLKVGRGGIPSLAWADDGTQAQVRGGRVYLVGGLGGAGGTAVEALVIDQAQAGMRLDGQVEADFRGAPIVNAAGHVVGVATSAYRPLGFASPAHPFVPFINASCKDGDRGVLICPTALQPVPAAGN